MGIIGVDVVAVGHMLFVVASACCFVCAAVGCDDCYIVVITQTQQLHNKQQQHQYQHHQRTQ